MKLTISEELVPPIVNPTSSYMVEIRSSSGDEDAFVDWSVGPFLSEQEESLQCLLETLRRMEEAFPRGMTGKDRYDLILGFQQWFYETHTMEVLKKEAWKAYDEHGEEAHQKIFDLFQPQWGSFWPSDVFSEDSPQQLQEYNVFYYDSLGGKHEVRIDW